MSQITIYTLPGCKHCSTLKSWFNNLRVPYIEEALSTDIQTDLIMDDIFSDPPIIKMDEGLIAADEMFINEELNEPFLIDCLGLGEFLDEYATG